MSYQPASTGRPPNGWYPDPEGTPTERYWDGTRWTQHQRPVPLHQPQIPPSTTPTYAPWIFRVLAALLDWVVLLVITSVIQAIVPFPGTETLVAVQEALLGAIRDGQVYEWWNYDGFWWAMASNIAISLALYVAYHALLQWRWGATVGKLALGLRVVVDGQETRVGLPGRTAFLRALSLGVFNYILIFDIINVLSPIWRPKRQAFHDSIAHTVVLKVS